MEEGLHNLTPLLQSPAKDNIGQAGQAAKLFSCGPPPSWACLGPVWQCGIELQSESQSPYVI